MLKYFWILLLFTTGCRQPAREKPIERVRTESMPDATAAWHTIGAIPEPPDFTRVEAGPGSFATWLRKVPLKNDKTVYLYNGKVKPNQAAQFAVIDIPVGKQDLQQCADAVMRLRAEYLFEKKDYSTIAFMDYNGKWYRWTGTNNRPAFDSYLQTVFGWCGSASLQKQLKPVVNFKDIKSGDVLVQGGFPGHAMMVVDMAFNKKGEKLFMLAQGYQPAQDMHVVNNPANQTLSPWYKVEDMATIITPEWQFRPTDLRTWE